MTAGSTVQICGTDKAPAGWVTTSIGGVCATVANILYYSRTIIKVEGMPSGVEVKMCGNAEPVPAGWVVTLSNGGMCGMIGSTVYFSRTIKKSSAAAMRMPDNTVSENQSAVANIGDETGSTFNVKASPNPTYGEFSIQVTGNNPVEKVNICVYDIYGRLMEVRKGVNTGNTISIGRNYVPGQYLLEVSQRNRRKQIRLIRL
jgi:hypothetical protein